jgi:poly(A) polymerase
MTRLAELLDNAALQRVLGLLDCDGEETRVVGGAVRNALIGRPCKDVDLATTAVPDIVMARARAARLRAIPTGIDHGTVTLLADGQRFEVTTLREDVETDGRHAKIRFGRDFAQDAFRRDFTINALSLGKDGSLYDYMDGKADVLAGRVRFIGEPATRIREDYLRILRFFRFSAEYATGELDEPGLLACIRERDGPRRLSRERVKQELFKLLMAPRAVFALRAMSDCGLLQPILEGIAQLARLDRLLAIAPDAPDLVRLAACAIFVADDAPRLREALRLSNAETERLDHVARVATRWHGAGLPGLGALREAMFLDRPHNARDGLLLAWAEADQPDETAWRAALRFLIDTPEPRLPFSAVDLMDRGLDPGPPLGAALKALQAKWIRAGFPEDPRSLAALLDEVTKRSSPDD